MSYLCPKCGHEQTCPCPACQKQWPTDKPWIWVNEESIACAGCGYTALEDWWFEQELEQYDKGLEE
jgi:hypothetical protein